MNVRSPNPPGRCGAATGAQSPYHARQPAPSGISSGDGRTVEAQCLGQHWVRTLCDTINVALTRVHGQTPSALALKGHPTQQSESQQAGRGPFRASNDEG